jgi:hypothetical protein
MSGDYLCQCSPEQKAVIRAGIARAVKRRKAGEGYIYVAEVIGKPDAIKIGFSLDPDFRIKTLSFKARLLGYFQATWAAEQYFHRSLSNCRHPDFPRQEIYLRNFLKHGAA